MNHWLFQNFGRSRPLFLPTLNSEKEALKEDSSSSSASSSDEQEIDQKQEQLIAEMEEIDDAIDQSYEANDEDCATPQNDQTNSLHVEKSVQSRFRPHSLNVIGALVNNCEQRRERNKFTFGNVDSSHKVVKKGEEEGERGSEGEVVGGWVQHPHQSSSLPQASLVSLNN